MSDEENEAVALNPVVKFKVTHALRRILPEEVGISVPLARSELAWLEKHSQDCHLNSKDKALRCCLNYAAVTKIDLERPSTEVFCHTHFDIEKSQLEWLDDQGEPYFVVRRVVLTLMRRADPKDIFPMNMTYSHFIDKRRKFRNIMNRS